jgi:uncharacterized membrane protein
MLLAAGLVALSFAVSLYALPRVPDQVATHWNAAGQPDGSMAKLPGLLLLPAATAGLLVLLSAVPRIDPLRENVAAFREYYDWLVVFLAAFMAFVNGLVVAYNLGYDVNVARMLSPALGLLFVFVGVLLEEAERNWLVGIRTPWTLSSDEVWERTHRLGGTLFKAAGVVAFAGVLLPEYALWFVVVPAIATAVFTTVYSFVVYRRLDVDGDPATG